jgi:hypothetical protein
MLDQVEKIRKDEENFQSSTQTPRVKHPCFSGSADPRGSGKFFGGSGIAA